MSSESSGDESPRPSRKIVIDSDHEIFPSIQQRPSPAQSTQSVKTECERCKNFQANAEHAWSVVRSATLKYSRNVELENENEQLNRINEEQAIYIQEQQHKIKELETSNTELSSANLNLEQRVTSMQSQYKMVVAKANEAKSHADAANEWRLKYESSQNTLIELHKSKKKTLDKYLAAVKLAKKATDNCNDNAKELLRIKDQYDPLEEELDEFRRTFKELFNHTKTLCKFLESRKNLERTQPVIKAISGFVRIEETKKTLLNSVCRPRTRSRAVNTPRSLPSIDTLNLDEHSEAGDQGEDDLEVVLERMLQEQETIPAPETTSVLESTQVVETTSVLESTQVLETTSVLESTQVPETTTNITEEQFETIVEPSPSVNTPDQAVVIRTISIEEIFSANFFREMDVSPLITNIDHFKFSVHENSSPSHPQVNPVLQTTDLTDIQNMEPANISNQEEDGEDLRLFKLFEEASDRRKLFENNTHDSLFGTEEAYQKASSSEISVEHEHVHQELTTKLTDSYQQLQEDNKRKCSETAATDMSLVEVQASPKQSLVPEAVSNEKIIHNDNEELREATASIQIMNRVLKIDAQQSETVNNQGSEDSRIVTRNSKKKTVLKEPIDVPMPKKIGSEKKIPASVDQDQDQSVQIRPNVSKSIDSNHESKESENGQDLSIGKPQRRSTRIHNRKMSNELVQEASLTTKVAKRKYTKRNVNNKTTTPETIISTSTSLEESHPLETPQCISSSNVQPTTSELLPQTPSVTCYPSTSGERIKSPILSPIKVSFTKPPIIGSPKKFSSTLRSEIKLNEIDKSDRHSLTSEPSTKKSKIIRVLVPIKEQDFLKKLDVKSFILNTFDKVVNGKLKIMEAYVLFLKQIGPHLNDISSSILADYMIDVVRKMNVGDIWPLVRAKSFMPLQNICSDEFITKKEKLFFEFAVLLAKECHWEDLLQHFFKKLSTEIIKANDLFVSLPNLSKNYRCLIISVAKLKNISLQQQENIQTVYTMLKHLLYTKPAETTIPLIIFVLLIEKETILNFIEILANDPVFTNLFRLHLCENHDGRQVIMKIIDAYNKELSEVFAKELKEDEIVTFYHSLTQDIKNINNGFEIVLNEFKLSTELAQRIRIFASVIIVVKRFPSVKFTIISNIMEEIKLFFGKLNSIEKAEHIDEEFLNLSESEVNNFSNLLILLTRLFVLAIITKLQNERTNLIHNFLQYFIKDIRYYKNMLDKISIDSQKKNIILCAFNDFLKHMQSFTTDALI